MPVNPTKLRVPKNGAVRVETTENPATDLKLLRTLYETMSDVAHEQGVGGDDFDDVEQSIITGHYDWRAYLREELEAPRDPRIFREVPE